MPTNIDRRTFLRQSSLVALTLAANRRMMAQLSAEPPPAEPVRLEPGRQEYAAGAVTLPFKYTATVSSAPRPASLDFTSEHGHPDNSQALVRIDGELWQFKNRFTTSLTTPPARYSGPDIDHMTQREDGSLPPGYPLAWFLGGIWYDETERKLYAPMHIEATGINRDGPVAPWPSRKIILATSIDKGLTWKDEGDIITPETYFYIPDAYKFAGSCYSNGLCDHGFYTDVRGGYFYIFPMESWLTKGTWFMRWTTRAARCAISDRMAPGKWRFFYNGKWDEPALGGKSSVVIPSQVYILYSEYLKKYIGVLPSAGGLINQAALDGVYWACCTDLGKQDWQFMHFPEAMFGFMHVMNAEGTDLVTCGQTFRYYAYGDGNTFQRIDVKLEEGQTAAPGLLPRYSFDPHPESSDSIQGRRTKLVGAYSNDMTYGGTWGEKQEPASFEGRLKECSTSGTIEFSFKGPAIYWRALRSPDSGCADVHIDGQFRKTVDCYAPLSSDYEQIVYYLTGLSQNDKHTIRVTVAGAKNPVSKGAAVRHIGFEYGAESYRASAGFSSLQGKENWSYRQCRNGASQEMRFFQRMEVFMNYWVGEEDCRIGPEYQMPAGGALVREWSAPHDGIVRIEGRLSVETGQGLVAGILKNATELWPERPIPAGAPTPHDLTVPVIQGDVIRFVVSQMGASGGVAAPQSAKVHWDPVVTYNTPAASIWVPNRPGPQNIALGKYARSKRLWHGYRPFDAVDGSIDTHFTIMDVDPMAWGEDWLMVDLDKPHWIDRYVVVSLPPEASWRPADFVLQKSDDGFSWTDADTVVKTMTDRIERAVTAFKARYVRLYLPHGKPFSINEFELYYTEGNAVADESAQLPLR